MDTNTSRRHFLKTALTLPAALAVGPALLTASADPAPPAPAATTPAASPPLPTRPLGRSGRQVSMISLGGMMNAYSPEYLDIAYSMGIRYFDTAHSYIGGQSEHRLGAWLAKYPERRKEVFIVTKDSPRGGPQQLLQMIDQRLAAIGTDHLDLIFIHGISPRDYPGSLDWPKSDDFKRVADQLKSSGKVKHVGFSCHDPMSPQYLAAAAEGGFLDAIMVKYTPFFEKGDPFDKGLEACHQAGIGLIAMKTLRNAADAPKRLPEFDKLGLTTHQALLQAVWSDPRISAVCNRMENVDNITASVAAVRSYKAPLKIAHLDLLRQTLFASRQTMCPGCAACNQLGSELPFAFGDISRFVMYYEQDGNLQARDLYQQLPAAHRDASTVNLAALRDACQFKTDYPEIIRRAERYFA